jgi:Carboxypeptidase regulatory-like domain
MEMKTMRPIVIATALLLLFTVVSCDKIGGALKKVEGKVAGQVLNTSGHGRGYVTIELIPTDGSDNFVSTTEEAGNFLFDEIPPGEYTMHVKLSGEDSKELPSDTPTIKLGPGRTLTQNVILSDEAAPAT